MHECPACMSYCDCDGEDHHNDAASGDCIHPGTAECLEEQGAGDADDYADAN